MCLVEVWGRLVCLVEVWGKVSVLGGGGEGKVSVLCGGVGEG